MMIDPHWNTLSEYEEGDRVRILCALPDAKSAVVVGSFWIDANGEHGFGSDVELPGMPVGWLPV